MKVYIGTDIEGVSGVVSFETQASAVAKYYDAAKKLLTAEINAAVEGLLEMGVDDILVMDGHGSGGIDFESLHPAAKVILGRPCAPRAVRDEETKNYDVCMMIGQHAMAGTIDGNLNHTQSSRTIDYYELNGKLIGEIAQFALYQGAMGLPMIFLSGDEAACREAEELIPSVTTAAVKKGLSRNSAICLSAEQSHRLIKQGVKDAVAKHQKSPIPPLEWKGPFVLEKRFFHSHDADGAATGDAERVDSQTVRYHSDNIKEIAYR